MVTIRVGESQYLWFQASLDIFGPAAPRMVVSVSLIPVSRFLIPYTILAGKGNKNPV